MAIGKNLPQAITLNVLCKFPNLSTIKPQAVVSPSKYSSRSNDKFFETTFSILELEHPVIKGKTRENMTRVT